MGVSRFVLCVLSMLAAVQTAGADDKMGHSRHGSAFDTGLRQKPWRMEGIGKAHFPISTKVPEVQEWFDQGNALLQSFWYEEAERSIPGPKVHTTCPPWRSSLRVGTNHEVMPGPLAIARQTSSGVPGTSISTCTDRRPDGSFFTLM
ncbi:MAG: hypothetical protein IT435_12640 [Phycisphaerales bacterium]|nr:hypothetical protein [Phycisphaerales bacterium]